MTLALGASLLVGCGQMTMPEIGRFDERLRADFPAGTPLDALTAHLEAAQFRTIPAVVTPDAGQCFIREYQRPFLNGGLYRRVCAKTDPAGRVNAIDVWEMGV